MTSRERLNEKANPLNSPVENPVIPKNLRTLEEPPVPFINAVFRDGDGRLAKTQVDRWALEEVHPIQALIEERERFKNRQIEIPRDLRALSRKRKKHGGRSIPQKERTDRRNALLDEKRGIADKITDRTKRIGRLADQLEILLPQSHPLFPLTVEIEREVKIIKGRPLSRTEYEWWNYVREMKKQGPWRLIRENSEEADRRFLDIQEYFVARLELSWAQREADKNRERAAQSRHDKMWNKLDEMSNEDYEPIQSDIADVTGYIEEKRTRGEI